MSVSNDSKKIYNNWLGHLDNAVTHTEPLDKLAKITFKTIGLIAALGKKISVGMENLALNARGTADVIESVCLIGRIKELACPDAQGKYFLQKNTYVKCADRIFLTGAAVFKTINVTAKFGLIKLGRLAKFAVGKIPVLKLIPDSLVIASSFFSVWDNSRASKKANKDLAVTNKKIAKWENRTSVVAGLRENNEWTRHGVKKDYEGKVSALQSDLLYVSKDIEELSSGDAKKARSLAKYQARLDLIKSNQWDILTANLNRKDASHQLKNWSAVKKNQQFAQNKAWFGIANGVSKIGVISFAMIAVPVGLTTAPWVISLAAASIAVDSFSLAKSLYELSAKKA